MGETFGRFLDEVRSPWADPRGSSLHLPHFTPSLLGCVPSCLACLILSFSILSCLLVGVCYLLDIFNIK